MNFREELISNYRREKKLSAHKLFVDMFGATPDEIDIDNDTITKDDVVFKFNNDSMLIVRVSCRKCDKSMGVGINTKYEAGEALAEQHTCGTCSIESF